MTFERKIMPYGLHDIPADEYHRDPCAKPSLSSSVAKLILQQSPLHGWTASPRLNPNWEPIEKKTFDIGRAAHRAVLGKGGDYVAIPDDLLASNGAASTKAAKQFIEDARAAGMTPLKGDEIDQIEAMAEVARISLAEKEIRLDPDRSELSALAEIDGVACRAMVDNAPAESRMPLMDFKTCEDASPQACARAVMSYSYDVQAAHYLDVWEAATGERRRFRFIFQEKSAPFGVTTVLLSQDDMVIARKKIARARQIWDLCLTNNDWPCYPLADVELSLPAFFQERWLERESMEADHRRGTGYDALDYARRWQSPEGV